MEMNQEEFLLQHLTEDKSYRAICEEHGAKLTQLQEWWESGTEMRSLIKNSNSLFSSKKNKEEFLEFQQAGKRDFFEWFRKQNRTCAYCGIEEYKLQMLFDKASGILSTKRGRGRTLELERKDTDSNQYTANNCVLACYFCNNHKSDILSEKEHREYFAPQIRKYLEDKYRELTGSDN